jgi:hypothetical protein
VVCAVLPIYSNCFAEDMESADFGANLRFYKNEQKPDEVLMIKCYDSWTKEGLARRAPHCAFKDPERDGEEWGNRESIEIRAVVVYDE